MFQFQAPVLSPLPSEVDYERDTYSEQVSLLRPTYLLEYHDIH